MSSVFCSGPDGWSVTQRHVLSLSTFPNSQLSQIYMDGSIIPGITCSPLAIVLVQVSGGEVCGRTTGAKALFCLTAADTMLAGEKEKMPEELLQLEVRLVVEAMVGLEGTIA